MRSNVEAFNKRYKQAYIGNTRHVTVPFVSIQYNRNMIHFNDIALAQYFTEQTAYIKELYFRGIDVNDMHFTLLGEVLGYPTRAVQFFVNSGVPKIRTEEAIMKYRLKRYSINYHGIYFNTGLDCIEHDLKELESKHNLGLKGVCVGYRAEDMEKYIVLDANTVLESIKNIIYNKQKPLLDKYNIKIEHILS